MNFKIVPADIMNIVCGNKRYARFLGYSYKLRIYPFLLIYSVILKLKIIISSAENAVLKKCRLFCLFILSV